MKLIIKILKGDEYIIEAMEDATVLDVKIELEKKSSVPVEHQKLLLVGKTLADEKPVASYGSIKDGTKLTLVIKKPDSLREAMLRHFKKYLQEEQSQRVTSEFMKDFDSKIQQLSLDDLEKIASDILAKKGQRV
ncbi:ubiquitin-like protein 4A-B [Sabethes cyaneus]|uniref:ubiquitin-like protein 4A-B n=1 Tax=Sabethes cyaneus TaxID=53552 RepID=UPI00221E2F12|nr:ubiquitin-like protein 4A-B [Sabethes cyaneus]